MMVRMCGGARRAGVGSVVVALVLLVGCQRSPARDNATGRVAGVYAAVIVALADKADGDHRPVVFVTVTAETKPIVLEVQAAVLTALVDKVTVRFVDADVEAIDAASADRAVTTGVLLRVGAVPTSGDRFEMEVERYRSVADRERVTLSVVSGPGGWTATVTSTGPVRSG